MIFNIVSNIVDTLCENMYKYISTFLMSFRMFFREVKHGRNLRFYGFTKIKKNSRASIIIGDNCVFRSGHTSNLIGINRPCILSAFEAGSVLTIGKNCGLSGTVIGCFSEITIGNNVSCGANTLITDSDWHLDNNRTIGPSPIHIADNVWLGANVTVLKGVSIGENVIIGAGSVVTKSIPDNVIAAGNPCKVLREIAK